MLPARIVKAKLDAFRMGGKIAEIHTFAVAICAKRMAFILIV